MGCGQSKGAEDDEVKIDLIAAIASFIYKEFYDRIG
jgi:hypothetical protein